MLDPVTGQPSRLIAVVGDYDPATIQLEQTAVGSMLAFTPSLQGDPATLGATWHIGAQPSAAMQDDDSDGLPDGWEIRYAGGAGFVHAFELSKPVSISLITDLVIKERSSKAIIFYRCLYNCPKPKLNL